MLRSKKANEETDVNQDVDDNDWEDDGIPSWETRSPTCSSVKIVPTLFLGGVKLAQVQGDKVEELTTRVLALDEESLWKLVCLLFPDAAEETLEDIYDAILSTSRRSGPRIPADEVFADEDNRRGMDR